MNKNENVTMEIGTLKDYLAFICYHKGKLLSHIKFIESFEATAKDYFDEDTPEEQIKKTDALLVECAEAKENYKSELLVIDSVFSYLAEYLCIHNLSNDVTLDYVNAARKMYDEIYEELGEVANVKM